MPGLVLGGELTHALRCLHVRDCYVVGMPPLPVVPNVVKAVISTLRSDANVENILHIAYTGSAPSADDLGTFLSSAFTGAVETLYNAEGSTDLTGVSIELTDLASDTGASVTAPLTVTGVRTGDFAPSSAAVVTSWVINRRYRGGHPRTYWPFGTAGTYASGSAKLWDPGFITNVDDDVGDFISAWVGTVAGATTFTELCNVSYVDKNTNPVPPYRRTTPVVDAITDHHAKQRICTQRRRLGKILG